VISKIKGRIWKFGDNVDTDVMTSGKYMTLPMDELKRHAFEEVRPEFAQEASPGDMILAGRNFGCGSSRETAPAALKELGIGAVVAESFARIFYRNSIAIGLPVIICPGAASLGDDGDEAEVNLAGRKVMNHTTGKVLDFQAFPDEMLRVLEYGGIEPLLKQMKNDQTKI
jgi:3-isopropylmalate/(R)-2-methylmalate dehydratase small subunit